MSCIEQMKYEILLDRISYKEARAYIENNSEEIYYVAPGYKIFKDYHIIGVPPVALGVKGNALIFTYTKPCYGTFVLTVDNEESIKEIAKLREKETKKENTSVKKSKPSKKAKKTQVSFSDIWKK
ncbi:MAG: DUF1894 domain-containing protein [Methanosarcinaceae archaeon]|nr:DUF1894 domain-containing protein [Methanosarcinaceae archaeon]MDD4332424.1 DUF1894 domain-containing protein [Methanosarcinaceae archaeon]MDD4749595.1 DUF1894 domain-containing protein [Methanosarcinaceae archaeon]